MYFLEVEDTFFLTSPLGYSRSFEFGKKTGWALLKFKCEYKKFPMQNYEAYRLALTHTCGNGLLGFRSEECLEWLNFWKFIFRVGANKGVRSMLFP